MKVKLVSDGRVFTPDGNDDYEPGDVAWFEEDVLLVTKIEDGIALAIEHPAGPEMMEAALDSVKRGRGPFEDAMRIHARTMAQMAAVAAKRAPVDASRPDAAPRASTAYHPDVEVAIDAVCAVAPAVDLSPFHRATLRLLGMLAKHRAPLTEEEAARITSSPWFVERLKVMRGNARADGRFDLARALDTVIGAMDNVTAAAPKASKQAPVDEAKELRSILGIALAAAFENAGRKS